MSSTSTVSAPAAPSSSLRQADAAAVHEAVNSPRIGGLDFLRAIAVSFVIWGHSTEGRGALDVPGLAGLGVKIFFVLSGFLITRLLIDEFAKAGRIDFWGFYRRRFARLMPAFYLFLAFGVTVLWLKHLPIPWEPIVASMLYATNYYQAFTGAQDNLVAHCWSLAVEEQFYLLWPMLAALLMRRQANLARALVFIVLGVWCWRWFLLATTDASTHYLYRALETRADELAVGCLMAVLVRSPIWRGRLAAIVRLPGMALALIAAVYACSAYDSIGKTFKYGFAFMVEPPMIALLILSTVLVSGQKGWLAAAINNRFVVHVGQISYCMYLFHGLIGYAAQRVVEAHTGSAALGLVAAFAGIIALSSASFRWFETPMRRWISGSSARH